MLAAALQLAGDLTGFAVALASSALPVPHAPDVFKAAFALVDAQPRLREAMASQLGATRADLVISLGNAVALAEGRGGSALLVDAGQRTAALAEVKCTHGTQRGTSGCGGMRVCGPPPCWTR